MCEIGRIEERRLSDISNSLLAHDFVVRSEHIATTMINRVDSMRTKLIGTLLWDVVMLDTG